MRRLLAAAALLLLYASYSYAAPDQWNTAFQPSSDITYSTTVSTNDTATVAVSNQADGAQGTIGNCNNSGKWYFEFETTVNGDLWYGLGSGIASNTQAPGKQTPPPNITVGLHNQDSLWWINDTSHTSGAGTGFGTGTIRFAVDLTAHLLWFQINAFGWFGNGGASPDPATGTNGFNFGGTTLDKFPWYIMWFSAQNASGPKTILRTTTANFNFSAPSGFEQWATGSTCTPAINGGFRMPLVQPH